MALRRLHATIFLLALVAPAPGKEYSNSYTFLADRMECDGQCTYCRHAHNQYRWSDIRTKLTRYVNRPLGQEGQDAKYSSELLAVIAADRHDVQQFIDWSWQKGAHFECIIGIIALRMLSYGYSDPFQFNEGAEFNVLEWLDVFNSHTGALDLLTSSWAALLAGGWPVFRELLHISRKLKDRLADNGNMYPQLTERQNECDVLDSKEDVTYRDIVKQSMQPGKARLTLGIHLVAMARGIRCPFGKATALLSMALDMVHKHNMYQGHQQLGEDQDELVPLL